MPASFHVGIHALWNGYGFTDYKKNRNRYNSNTNIIHKYNNIMYRIDIKLRQYNINSKQNLAEFYLVHP